MKEGKYFTSNFQHVFSKYLCHIRTKKVKEWKSVTSERHRKNYNLVARITQIFRVWRPLALSNAKFVASHSLSDADLSGLMAVSLSVIFSWADRERRKRSQNREYQGSRYGLLQGSIHTTVSRRGIALAWIKIFNRILRKHGVKLLNKRTRL